MVIEPLIGQELQGAALEFIDYARWIISAMILYYVIRFFTVSDEEEDKKTEQEWHERGEKFSQYISNASKKIKQQNAARGRTREIAAAKSELISAVQSIDETIDAITSNEFKKFEKSAKAIDRHIHRAMKDLRHLQHKIPPNKLSIASILGTLQLQRQGLTNKRIIKNGPGPTTLQRRSGQIRTDLNSIRTGISTSLNEILNYEK